MKEVSPLYLQFPSFPSNGVKKSCRRNCVLMLNRQGVSRKERKERLLSSPRRSHRDSSFPSCLGLPCCVAASQTRSALCRARRGNAIACEVELRIVPLPRSWERSRINGRTSTTTDPYRIFKIIRLLNFGRRVCLIVRSARDSGGGRRKQNRLAALDVLWKIARGAADPPGQRSG